MCAVLRLSDSRCLRVIPVVMLTLTLLLGSSDNKLHTGIAAALGHHDTVF